MEENQIAWQNKDIISKIFAENLKGKSLEVYGIHVPEVDAVLPTNLPLIQADELRIDNVFLLKDQSLAIIDYESSFSTDDKWKYIGYIRRIAQYYSKEWNRELVIRMIVIYTADIERKQVKTAFDLGCLTLSVDAAFLSELNSGAIYKNLRDKITSGQKLSDEDMMRFIILPMSYKGSQAKNDAIRENIDLAEKLPDDDTKIFILSGMTVMANHVIEQDSLDRIRRLIHMTRLGQMIEDEKLRYAEETERQMVKKMLDDGVAPDTVLKYSTLLSRKDIERILKETNP